MDRHSNSSKNAVLATIIYSDIFQYPLTQKEIWRFLHAENAIPKNKVIHFLHQKGNGIVKRKGFYMLEGKEDFGEKRQKGIAINKRKYKKAQKVARVLAKIPTICFIGISGSVSMANATEKEDIDLFFITKKHTLWLTRLIITLLLDSKGWRRKRLDTDVEDKICVNMLMDESKLAFSKEHQNIYIAHELLQVKSLFDRGGYYKKLLQKNIWGKHLLFNGFPAIRHSFYFNIPWTFLLLPFEVGSHIIQQWYMKDHTKHEILTDTLLAFHPTSYERIILRKYRKGLEKYGI